MGLPGRGVAYGTACDSHLLNVPAKDMSAFPQYPEHFLSWAKSNYDREVRPAPFFPAKNMVATSVHPQRSHPEYG